MNKAQKIIIATYVSVCFLISLVFFIWYFKFNQNLLNAFLYGEYSGDYSRMDFILSKILILDLSSWVILAIPTFLIYKHWVNEK